MKNQSNINQEVVNDQKSSKRQLCAASYTTSPVPNKVYTLGQPQAFVFFPGWSITNGACGPTSYSITANGGPAVAPYFSIIGPPTRNIYYWSDRISDVGVKTIRLTGVSTHGGNTAYTEFTITYLNPCPAIAPTYTSTLGPQSYYVNDPADFYQIPAFTYNSNGVDCGPISYQLFNGAYGAPDPVFTFITANTTLVVFGSGTYLVGPPFVNYQLIIRGTMSNGLYAEYMIIFNFAIDCNKNQVVPQSDITETYFIYDPDKVITSSFTAVFDGFCPGVTSYSCKFGNNSACSTSSKIIFDPVTATLNIVTTNVETDVSTFIVYIIGSTPAGIIGTRTLTINIECDCRCADITSTPIGFLGEYDIMNSTQNTHTIFNAAWLTTMSICSFSYSFLDVDTGLPISPSIFSNDASQNLLLHTSKLVPPKFYTINVTGCLHPLVCDTQQMTINITDQCATAVISPNTPPDAIYTTSDPSQLLSFSQWTSTPAFCIYYDYVLTLDDNITVPTFAILNNATRQITVYTNDISQRGLRNVTLKGTLTQNNHAVVYFMVQVKVSCAQNVIGPAASGLLATYQYNITKPTWQIQYNDFEDLTQGDCGPFVWSAWYNSSLGQGPLILNFQEFIDNEDCVFPINYTYPIVTYLKDVVDGTQVQSKFLKINANDKKLAYNPDHNIIIQARVKNVNDTAFGQLKIPIRLVPINNAAPKFKVPLSDVEITAGNTMSYDFSDLYDVDSDKPSVLKCDISFAAQILKGSYPSFDIITDNSTALGTYKIRVTLIDDNPAPLQKMYELRINVIPPIPPKANVSMVVTDQQMISKDLTANLKSINMQGKAEIQFSQAVKVPKDYWQINQDILSIQILDDNGKVRKDVNFTWSSSDQLKVSFKSNGYFVERSTGLLRNDGIQILILHFNQAATRALIAMGGSAANAFSSIMYGTLIMNLILSASLQYLWGMISVVQMIVHMPLLNVDFPANAMFFYSLLMDMSTFDVLPTSTVEDEVFTFSDQETFQNFQLMDIFQFKSIDAIL
eukprot:403371334